MLKKCYFHPLQAIQMEFKDIVVLIAAVIAWIYSSYRNFQKEAAKKAKKVAEFKPEPQASPPAPQPKRSTVKPVVSSRQVREVIKKSVEPVSYAPTGSLEKEFSDISTRTSRRKAEKEQKIDVDKINIAQNELTDSSDGNSALLTEIHSGKTDWRKAIILSEVIRPVYF